MRHNKHRHQLGVKKEHRTALMANLASSLFIHGRIRTTLAKAKALRPFAEKIITLAKKANNSESAAASVHYRRQAIAKLRNKEAAKLLFNERVSEFVNRDGGYTRIYKVGPRLGDAAEMALIELISADDEGYSKPKAKKEKSSAMVASDQAAATEEIEAVEVDDTESATGESEVPEKASS